MFREGDKVTIRSDLHELGRQDVGCVGTGYDMSIYEGGSFEITRAKPYNGRQRIYALGGIPFSWSAEMFASVENNPTYKVGELVFSNAFDHMFPFHPILCKVVEVEDKITISPIGYDGMTAKVYVAERPDEIRVQLTQDTPFGTAGEIILAYKHEDISDTLLVPSKPPFTGWLYRDEYNEIGG